MVHDFDDVHVEQPEVRCQWAEWGGDEPAHVRDLDVEAEVVQRRERALFHDRCPVGDIQRVSTALRLHELKLDDLEVLLAG